MKNILIGMFLLIVLTATSNAALIGYWPLDGNTLDATANGNNGTVVGDPQYVGGMVGQAMEFDGEGDGVTIANESFFDGLDSATSTMTVSFWVKIPYGARPYGNIVGKLSILNQTIDTSNPAKGAGWGFVNYSVSSENVTFFTRASNRITSYYNTVNDGKWHHIVGTRLNTTMQLYIDGVLLASGGSANVATDTPLTFGYLASRAGLWDWEGALDEVKVYDEVLDQAAVTALYDADKCASAINGDLNGDCQVDINDLTTFMEDWLDCNDSDPANCL